MRALWKYRESLSRVEKIEHSYTLNGALVFKYTLVTFLKFTVFEKLAKIEDEVRLINYTKTKIKIGQLQLRNRIIANRKSVLSVRKPVYNDPKTVLTALKLFLVDSKRNAFLYDRKRGLI